MPISQGSSFSPYLVRTTRSRICDSSCRIYYHRKIWSHMKVKVSYLLLLFESSIAAANKIMADAAKMVESYV